MIETSLKRASDSPHKVMEKTDCFHIPGQKGVCKLASAERP